MMMIVWRVLRPLRRVPRPLSSAGSCAHSLMQECQCGEERPRSPALCRVRQEALFLAGLCAVVLMLILIFRMQVQAREEEMTTESSVDLAEEPPPTRRLRLRTKTRRAQPCLADPTKHPHRGNLRSCLEEMLRTRRTSPSTCAASDSR